MCSRSRVKHLYLDAKSSHQIAWVLNRVSVTHELTIKIFMWVSSKQSIAILEKHVSETTFKQLNLTLFEPRKGFLMRLKNSQIIRNVYLDAKYVKPEHKDRFALAQTVSKTRPESSFLGSLHMLKDFMRLNKSAKKILGYYCNKATI